MLNQFELLIAQGRYVVKRFASIRVKLHVPCQWACNFCHMEGNHHSASVDSSAGLVLL